MKSGFRIALLSLIAGSGLGAAAGIGFMTSVPAREVAASALDSVAEWSGRQLLWLSRALRGPEKDPAAKSSDALDPLIVSEAAAAVKDAAEVFLDPDRHDARRIEAAAGRLLLAAADCSEGEPVAVLGRLPASLRIALASAMPQISGSVRKVGDLIGTASEAVTLRTMLDEATRKCDAVTAERDRALRQLGDLQRAQEPSDPTPKATAPPVAITSRNPSQVTALATPTRLTEAPARGPLGITVSGVSETHTGRLSKTIKYSISVANHGPGDVCGVTLSATVPIGTIPAEIPNGERLGGRVAYRLGKIPCGQSATAELSLSYVSDEPPAVPVVVEGKFETLRACIAPSQ